MWFSSSTLAEESSPDGQEHNPGNHKLTIPLSLDKLDSSPFHNNHIIYSITHQLFIQKIQVQSDWKIVYQSHSHWCANATWGFDDVWFNHDLGYIVVYYSLVIYLLYTVLHQGKNGRGWKNSLIDLFSLLRFWWFTCCNCFWACCSSQRWLVFLLKRHKKRGPESKHPSTPSKKNKHSVSL